MTTPYSWLSASLPDGQLSKWPLEKEVFLIGREEPSDMVLPFMSISRRHARITRDEYEYHIEDLGSRNGTYLNGEPVGGQPRRLREGDAIVLGGAITLRFHDPAGTVERSRVGLLEGVWIDPGSREVWVDAHRVEPPLSLSQFTLIDLLYRASGQVVSRAEVIAAVWPGADPAGVSKDAVDGLTKRLRARLRATQPEREYLEVVRGHGLRLIRPED